MSPVRDIATLDHVLDGGLHGRGPCPACRGLAGPRDLRPGLATVPGAPLVRAVASALMCGGPSARTLEGGWRRGRDGRLAYEYVGRSGGRIEVRLDGAGEDWSEIEALSTLTLDVLIAVLARLSDPETLPLAAAPNRRAVPFCANWPMRLKRYARYGDERRAFEWQIGSELGLLLRLRAKVFGYEGWIDGAETRLIEAVSDPDLQGTPALAVRFGDWAERWLNLRGNVRLALLPGEVFAFDHRANRGSDVLAKKLGLYSTLQWGRAGEAERLVRPVRSVLRQIGELQADIGSRAVRTGRLADRFDEALLRLAEIGSFGVRYRRIDRSEAVVNRGRGWTAAWLAEELIFERPSWLSDPSVEPAILA